MARRYVDQLLTNVSKGWRPRNHINEKILPVITVMKAAGKIGVYGADNLRLVTSIKSDEGETPVVTMTPTQQDAYVLETHAVKALASDKEKENEELPFNTERDKAELTMDILSVGREVALATFMSSETNITQYVALTTNDQWSADPHASSTPIADITTGINAVIASMACSAKDLSCIAPSAVLRQLQLHSTLRAAFQYTNNELVTVEQLAKYFGVKEFIEAEGVYNSANDGQADTVVPIWGKHFWIVKIADAKLKTQGFGFTPKRKTSLVTDKWYDNDRAGMWVRTTDEFDQYILSVTAAYLIQTAIA